MKNVHAIEYIWEIEAEEVIDKEGQNVFCPSMGTRLVGGFSAATVSLHKQYHELNAN